MDEYIKREALYEKAYWHGEHPDVDNPFPDGVDAIDIEDVDAIPAADVAPVVHGQWIYDKKAQRPYCSVCKRYFYGATNSPMSYCPNCGTKMDEGKI